MKTFRIKIENAKELQKIVKKYGENIYAISSGLDDDDIALQANEWVISQSLEGCVKEFFNWDKREMRSKWVDPTEEEKHLYGDDILGGWEMQNFIEGWEQPWDYSELPESLTPDEADIQFIAMFVDISEGYEYIFFSPDSEDTSGCSLKLYLSEWLEEESNI